MIIGTMRKKFGSCLFRDENDEVDDGIKWQQNPLENMEEERLKQIEMRTHSI